MKKDLYQKHIETFNAKPSTFFVQRKNFAPITRSAKPDGVIIIGMGGSGIAGDLLLGLKKEIKLQVPVVLWKNRGLPETHFKKPLFVFISFSGNTEETLSGLRQILNKPHTFPRSGARRTLVSVITTGGKLKTIAEKNKIPFISFLDQQLTPREAIRYTFHTLLLTLKSYFPEISVTAAFPKKHANSSSIRKSAGRLAKLIHSKIVLIYTNDAYSHIGYVWKIILNETGKHPTFVNIIPEMFHNEIASFEKNQFQFLAIFIIPSNCNKTDLKKIAMARRLLRSKRVRCETLKLNGNNKIESTWNAIELSHWVGLYLAKIKKTNPSTTPIIEKIKRAVE